MLHGPKREIDPFDRLEPADRQHVVAVVTRTQLICEEWWVIQGLRVDAIEVLQPCRGVCRNGESLLTLGPASDGSRLMIRSRKPTSASAWLKSPNCVPQSS